jgi:hypothetical protein
MTETALAIPPRNEVALMRAWSRLGVAFTIEPADVAVDLEVTVAQTAVIAPSNERLFVMAATWLSARHMLVDARRLVGAVEQLDSHASAVAGALLGLAVESVTGQTALHAAIEHCHPLRRPAPLFNAVRRHPTLLALVKREAPEVYRRWGLWHNDTRLAPDAVRPVRWTLRHCPELRLRALLGSGLDARVAAALADHPATITELAAATGATYAATHAAASRLAGRGLLEPPSRTTRPKRWRVSPSLLRATRIVFATR